MAKKESSKAKNSKERKQEESEAAREETQARAREHFNWEFDPIFPPHLKEMEAFSESLLEHPEEEDAYTELYESICGPTDDSQPVEQYDGTLGVTVAFVNMHQGPVGQLQWNNNLGSVYTNPGNVSGVRWCTGTLISNDLFLTAGHCFDQNPSGWTVPRIDGTFNPIPSSEIATNMHVNFNYQVDSSGVLRTEQEFAVLELVEYRLGGLDFAIVRLDGSPGSAFGTTEVSTTDAAMGETVCIIGHPAGVPKRIEAGTVFHLHDDRLGYNDIDTLGGNSGSGILRASDGRIVGVHTNGGCTSDLSGHNHGFRITSIIAQSPTLQALTRPKLKFADDGDKFKFLDDPVTLKFADDGGKFKFLDDPVTLKFADDGDKFKFLDETNPQIDPVKTPGLDKQPGGDFQPMRPPFGQPRQTPSGQPPRSGLPGGQAAPFVLATPHHSTAYLGGNPQQMATQYQQALSQCQQQISQLQMASQQGMLNPTGERQLQALYAQYRQLLQQYQMMLSGQPDPGGQGRV